MDLPAGTFTEDAEAQRRRLDAAVEADEDVREISSACSRPRRRMTSREVVPAVTVAVSCAEPSESELPSSTFGLSEVMFKVTLLTGAVESVIVIGTWRFKPMSALDTEMVGTSTFGSMAMAKPLETLW